MLNDRRRRHRRWLTATAVVAGASVALALGPGLPGGAAPGDSDAATLADPNRGMSLESQTTGRQPSVSGDGSRLVFVAPSRQLQIDGVAVDSVWLRDRATGTLTDLVSANSSLRAGASRQPVISRDGCTVVMVTEIALDLFRDDDSGTRWDVYRHVLPSCPGAFEPGEWQLISTTAIGEPVARDDVDPSQRPALSSAGTTVVYARRAIPDGGEELAWTSLDVVDATVPVGEPGRIETAPGLPRDLAPLGLAAIGQRDPVISDNGRFVAFTTDVRIETTFDDETLEEIVSASWPAGANSGEQVSGVSQVYRWDRSVNADEGDLTFRNVSANAAGQPGTAPSGHPAMSADGHLVAFVSADTTLDPAAESMPALSGSLAGATQVYVADLDPPPPPVVDGQVAGETSTQTVSLVSRTDDSLGLGSSTYPMLDARGDTIVFATTATNLTGDERRAAAGVDLGDIVIAELATGGLMRVTARADGVAADLGSTRPAISAAARVIVFESVVGAQLLGPEVEVPTGPQIISEELHPDLDVTPVDVGTVTAGLPSPEWETRVVNNGPGSFVPDSVTSSDGAFAITGGTCIAKIPVPAGQSCSLTVIFTPSADGVASSAIVLSESGFGARSATVLFSGIGGTPTIVANPPSQSAGSGVVGARSDNTITLTLTNVGPFDEIIATSTVGGADPDDFPVNVDACSGVSLPPGGVCEIQLGFRPTDAGRRNALVTFASQAGATTSAVISGVGDYRPGIAVGPNTLGSNDALTVGGLGFPAGATLSVGWSDTARRSTVAVGTDGAFSIRLPAVEGGPTGARTVVVTDPVGRFAPLESSVVLVSPARRAVPLNPAVRP